MIEEFRLGSHRLSIRQIEMLQLVADGAVEEKIFALWSPNRQVTISAPAGTRFARPLAILDGLHDAGLICPDALRGNPWIMPVEARWRLSGSGALILGMAQGQGLVRTRLREAAA